MQKAREKPQHEPANRARAIGLVIIAVGALLCGVGLLVAVPVGSLFLVCAWRRITGGQVAPLTP